MFAGDRIAFTFRYAENAAALSTGASNVNSCSALTVTTAVVSHTCIPHFVLAPGLLDRHASVVELIHDVVRHGLLPSTADGEAFDMPNDSPLTVTHDPPVTGACAGKARVTIGVAGAPIGVAVGVYSDALLPCHAPLFCSIAASSSGDILHLPVDRLIPQQILVVKLFALAWVSHQARQLLLLSFVEPVKIASPAINVWHTLPAVQALQEDPTSVGASVGVELADAINRTTRQGLAREYIKMSRIVCDVH